MANFGDLPDEIKLHIFSFLSARDLAGMNSVDRGNRNLVNQEARLWRARARQDFARELDDESANEAGYAALRGKMYAELDQEYGVILAMRWIHQKLGADQQHHMLEFNVHHDLPVLNRLDKDDLLRAFEFRTREQFFEAFVECRSRHMAQGDCTDVSDEDIQCVLDVASPEISYEEILKQYSDLAENRVIEILVATLVSARAPTALEFFLRKVPAAKLIEIQSLLVKACKAAMYYADVEMVKVLLRAGLDVNANVPHGEAHEYLLHSWSRQLENFIWRIENQAVFLDENGQEVRGLADDMEVFCANQLDNYAEIARIFLANGADPDLLPLGDRAITPRQAVTEAFNGNALAGLFIGVPFDHYQQVVNVVIDASALANNQEAEPELKRPRP